MKAIMKVSEICKEIVTATFKCVGLLGFLYLTLYTFIMRDIELEIFRGTNRYLVWVILAPICVVLFIISSKMEKKQKWRNNKK